MTLDTLDGLLVCVVEDEQRLRDLLVREITAMGHGAAGFRTADEAWPRIQSEAFDALLLDLNLPGMPGMELFRLVREARLDLSVVILTGFAEVPSAVQALRWQADDYLSKPCSLSDIENVLARVLSRKRVRSRAVENAERSSAEEAAKPDLTFERPRPAARTLEEIEREQILQAIEDHHGNKPAAAEQLGISLRTLYNKLSAYREQGLIR